jgi:hypothetical protein
MSLQHERTISPKKERKKTPKERHEGRKDSPPKERRVFLTQGKKDKGK